MNILPGWNSIEGVQWWWRCFNVLGLITLALTFVFGALIYVYGNRKDTLTAASEKIAAEQRNEQEQQQREADATVLSAVQGQLGEAQQEVSNLKTQMAWRTLSTEEHRSIVADLSRYRGHFIAVTKLGDAEAAGYADKIMESLTDAGWNIQRNYSGVVSPPIYGVLCTVPKQADSASLAVAESFKKAGVKLTVQALETASPDFIQIYVGLKPRE